MLDFKDTYNKYSLPNICKWLVQSIMQNADKLIAALFIGVHVLGIVSLFTPFMMVFIAITMLYVMGLNVKLNYYLGSGKKEEAEKLFTTIFILIILTISLFGMFCYVFRDNIFVLLKLPEVYLAEARIYFPILITSFVFLAGQLALDAAIIADRNPKFSAFLGTTVASLNLILNMTLVVKFNMGIKGLALATLTSSFIGFLIAAGYFIFGFNKSFRPKAPLLKVKPVLDIMYNGSSELFTAGSEGMIMFVCNTVILTFLTQTHLEAFSIATLVAPLLFNLSAGGIFGAQPIISELLGKGDVKTGFELMNYTMKRTFKYGLISLFLGIPLLLFFGKVLGQQSYLLEMYLPLGFGYVLSVFNFGSVVYITSIQRPLESIVSAVLRGSVIIPVFITASVYLLGDYGNGMSIGIGFVIAELLLLLPLFKYRKNIAGKVDNDLVMA